jgi:iron complex transport system substrate-binding protein
MAPSLTELLFALGLDEEIVGVTLFSDYPPEAREKNKVGSFVQPNIEAIIAARPDLTITATVTGSDQQKHLAMRLNRIDYNSLTLHLETVAGLFEAIEKIGRVTGRQSEADRLTHDLRTKLDKLSALVDTSDKVKVLYVVQRQPLRVAGRDTFVNEMIELAGGENAIGPTVHRYPPIGAEQVIGSGAEVIIEPAMLNQDITQQKQTAMEYWSRFSNIPAVKNGKIYVIKADTVARLGPRLYEGTETIARCLKPHLFEN